MITLNNPTLRWALDLLRESQYSFYSIKINLYPDRISLLLLGIFPIAGLN